MCVHKVSATPCQSQHFWFDIFSPSMMDINGVVLQMFNLPQELNGVLSLAQPKEPLLEKKKKRH